MKSIILIFIKLKVVVIRKKTASFNWKYGLSGSDYRVGTTGIILQSLKSIGKF